MNEQDVVELQVAFANRVATTVERYFDRGEFLDQAGDNGGPFDEMLFQYAHRYVDRVWEFEMELEPHDIEVAAQEVIRELESTTRVSPTVPVYVAEMLVDLAGGQRQVGAFLTKVVKDLWYARLPVGSPELRSAAQPDGAAQVGGILERIEANQRRIIGLMEEE